VCLATAHPAKFPEAVEAAIGVRPELPPRLADLFDRPERYRTVPNDLAVVEAAVAHPLSSAGPPGEPGAGGARSWRLAHPARAPPAGAGGTGSLGPVKYVVCVPDGCADEPVAALGGRTPLEAADLPVLRSLAARGEVGRAAVIPEGMPPG